MRLSFIARSLAAAARGAGSLAVAPAVGAQTCPYNSTKSTSAAGLRVTVMEGIGGAPQVTLLADKDADPVAFRPATVITEDLSGTDLSKGLPPPPQPSSVDPYKEEPMKLSAFAKGDVVEFSTVEPVNDGASFKVAKITWIMGLSAQTQQGGVVSDGTAAPPMPPTP